MGERIAVYVYADDPISHAGMMAQLRGRQELRPLDGVDLDEADVAVVVVDDVDEDAAQVVRAMQRNGCPRVVVVAARFSDQAVLLATEAGASGLLRRSDLTPHALAAAITAAAAGDGTLPADLLGRLLRQVGALQRGVREAHGLPVGRLTEREVAVLRLVADGHGTAEIGAVLYFSERTVKNIIHDVTSRLGLRNRSHAVAYALREGLI
jgi:DNA-binding NarL/FixJ family response regulator